MADKVTGWDLYSTLQDAAVTYNYYKTTLPMACPNCGEPLRPGPPQDPAILYCIFDFWQYPRDYDPETMSGI
jgi:hypothetical protein